MFYVTYRNDKNGEKVTFHPKSIQAMAISLEGLNLPESEFTLLDWGPEDTSDYKTAIAVLNEIERLRKIGFVAYLNEYANS